MSSVIVSNVPDKVTPAALTRFFTTAGKVTDLNPLSDGKYQVVFEDPKAASTALDLNDAELDNTFIKVDNDLEVTDGGKKGASQQGGNEERREEDVEETLSDAYGQIRHKH
ncbi:hypothetical protein CANMA_001950 [Candida margitis]|uniref:uncharacterized protein n=1 Tax=Candida margitis TaxID=1775924 RepID=UPI002225CE3E|nr:uncharacterized protein CANMA_001950 [Candida margitis]KAI5968954.1 hypothetical protein CANMA_001950 [Candida margitis]